MLLSQLTISLALNHDSVHSPGIVLSANFWFGLLILEQIKRLRITNRQHLLREPLRAQWKTKPLNIN